jgi:hypothetical protein
MVTEIALCSDFWLQTPPKNYKLHDILAYFESINKYKNLNTLLNMPTILGGYTTS